MDYRDKIESQIMEQYGKLMYSYTCHWEEICILRKYNDWVKRLEIILTAVSTTGIISFLFTDARLLALVGAAFSVASLALTLYSKEYDIDNKIIGHQNTADDLWVIREKYISLLADLEELSEKEIREKRDRLMADAADAYKVALPTSSKAYERAKKQLKEDEYQYFTQDELNKMLPSHLRKQNGKGGDDNDN